MSNGEVQVVLTTVHSEAVGREIANTLVSAGLVACAQLGSPIRSFYRWKGEVCEEIEFSLVLKTTASLSDKARLLFHDLHPYDLPQWVVLNAMGSERYSEWVNDCGSSR